MRLSRNCWVVMLPFYACSAWAGAWTQEAGKGRVIVTGAYYQAANFYNNRGTKQSQPNYHKYELNPYVEYGLYDDLTLGASFSFQLAQQNVVGNSDLSNSGVGESEYFVRKRLYNKDGLVASVEPMLKLPPLSSGKLPKLGSPNPDIGLGGSVGYGTAWFGYHHFVNLDTQYRHRFGDQKDQIRVAATVGIGVAPQWVVMPQAFMTYRMGDSSGFTQSAADDYDVTRLQLSGVYAVTEDTKLQAGAFTDVDGKNAGVGRGVLLSVWKNF